MPPKHLALSLFLLPLLLAAQITTHNPDNPRGGSWSFSPQRVWETEKIGERFVSPSTALTLGSDGSLYVFDQEAFQITRFSTAGQQEQSFGRKGEGPGEFRFVMHLREVGPDLAVADIGSIHLFSHQGSYRKTLTAQGDLEGYVEGQGLLCTQEDKQGLKLLLHRSEPGQDTLLDTLPKTEMLTASAGGLRLSVGDTALVPMLLSDSQGPTVLWGHSGTCSWTLANLKEGSRCHFTLEGRQQPAIPESFKENRFSRLKVNGQKLDSGMLKQLTRCIPDKGPFFTRVLLHESGLILVFLPDYSGDKNRCILDIFSPEGKYLHRAELRLPAGRRMDGNRIALRGSRLAVVTENDEEEPVVAAYTLTLPPTGKN